VGKVIDAGWLAGLALAICFPAFSSPSSSVTCSAGSPVANTIRNEGKAEQIADYALYCTNRGASSAVISVQAVISPSLPIASKSLNSFGQTEAAVIVQDSTGSQSTTSYTGSVSGSTVSFNSVIIPVSTDTSSYQPFILTITNIRVDATSLAGGAAIFESGAVSGATSLTLPSAQVSTVEPGLGGQSASSVSNLPVCNTLSASSPAFNVKFGENTLSPAAFKTQGGSGTSTPGLWETNNTETGYYVTVGGVSNAATSGTRVRVIFSNIPANANLYVPLSLSSDQKVSGVSVGSLGLTATESGAYSAATPAYPSGYSGSVGLSQIAVSSGTAEAVYEVLTNSATTAETYSMPVYIASSGTITSQGAITATVSFAPVNASANLPNFSQLSSTTTTLTGSSFPTCLSITTSSFSPGVVGGSFNQSVAASGGVTPYTWSLSGGTLPPGLILNTSTGSVSGTPTSSGGSPTFAVTVADSSGQQVSKQYSIQIDSAVYTASSAPPTGAVGDVYSTYSLTAAGGFGSYTWSILSGSLPNGLSLNQSTGAITGTPRTAGRYPVNFSVLDSSGTSATQSLTFVINVAISITTSTLPVGVVGTSYPVTNAAANGGTGGYSWSLASGASALSSAGLAFSSSGVFSGTPTAAGPIALTLQVTDQNGGVATQALTLTVNASLTITTLTLPADSVGTYYSQQISATGGAGSNQWLVSAGSLPAGIVLTALGYLSGTPTASGTFSFTARVTDADSDLASQAFTLQVNPALTITSAAQLPNAIANYAYSDTLVATGGIPPYTWSISGANGLYPITLSSSGVLSGTYGGANTASTTITVKDSGGSYQSSVSQSFNLTILPQVTFNYVSMTDVTSPLGYFRLQGYSGTSELNGYTWAYSSSGAAYVAANGQPGQSITNQGAVSLDGMTGAVTTNLSGGITTAATITAWVNLAVLPSTRSNFSYVAGESTVGNDLDLQFSTNNTINWYTTNGGQYISYTPDPTTLVGAWHFIAVTFDNTAGKRVIYWDGLPVASDTTQSIPNKAGNFQIGATSVFPGRNFQGDIDEVGIWNYALTPAEVALLYGSATQTFPGGNANQSYGPLTLGAIDGSGSYSWSATGLPNGLTLASNGLVSGAPSAPGTYSIVLSARDTVTSQLKTENWSMTVQVPLSITTSTLPAATVNSAYSQQLTGYGGTTTGYTWTVSSGSLPAGLTLSSGGLLSGTPTATGSSTFTAQLTDSGNNTAQQSLTLQVNSAAVPVSITTLTIPQADQGSVYSTTLAATGGTGPYTWSLESGTLPNYLAVLPSGAINGSPQTNTATGNYNITVKAMDSLGASATQALALYVNPQLTFSVSTLANGMVGNAYSSSLVGSGGKPPYTYNWGSTAIPGLTFNSTTGQVSGTPTTAGSYYVVMNLVDSLNNSLTNSFHMTIAAAPTITTTLLPAGQQGTPYSATLSATGGSGSGYTYSLQSGALPGGLTLSPGGTISGTPLVYGTFSVTIKVTDSANASSTASFSFVVSLTGTVITTNLPSNTAIVNISGTQYGAGSYSGTGQAYWYQPFAATAGPLLEYTIQPGTYTFRVVDPADAQTIYPALTQAQASNIFTGWTYNSPWIETYLVFDSSAASNSGVSQLFSGADQQPGSNNAQAAYNLAVSGGYYNQISVGSRTATPTSTYTFANPQTLIFAVPDYALGDNSGGVSVLISRTFPALSIVSQTLPNAVVGTSYSQTFASSGGSGTLSWSATGVPAGLTVSAGGVLSGTPTSAGLGANSIAVTVTDLVSGQTATSTFSLTVTTASSGPLTVFTTSLPNTSLGASYSQTLMATGGTGTYSWRVTAGGLPNGLTLSTGGVLNGTPTAVGDFTFTVQVNDQADAFAGQQFSIQVNPGLSITTTLLPAGLQGQAYAATLAATGGSGSGYQFGISSGSLPTGMTLSPAGVLSGTPSRSGNYPVVFKVTDNGNATATAALNLFVSGVGTVITANLPANTAIVNIDATQYGAISDGEGYWYRPFTASEGTALLEYTVQPGTYTFRVINPTDAVNIYSGLTQSQSSSIFTAYSYAPQVFTTSYLVFDSSASSNLSTTQLFSGAIPPTAYSAAPDAYTGAVTGGYENQIQVGNQSAEVSYTYTFTSPETLLFAVPVSNPSGDTGGVSILISPVFTPPVSITTASPLPAATQGMAYSQTLAATGGSGIYSWSSVYLPGGFALSAAGVLTGTPGPTQVGANAVSVTVLDMVSGQTASMSFTLTVNAGTPPSLTITSTALPKGAQGAAYFQSLAASGGTGSVTWAVTTGSLPGGLTLSPGGVLSGTPTVNGTFTFSVTATDQASNTASQQLTLVLYAPLTITTVTLPAATQGTAYSRTLTATGGSGTDTWSATGAPAGTFVSAGGVLSGTPTAAGTYTVVATVTDSVTLLTAHASLTLTVAPGQSAPPPVSVSESTGFIGVALGGSVTASFSALGGTAPFTFSASGLPTGVTVSGNGALSGTPTQAGSFNATIQVVDSKGMTASASITISVLGLTTTSLPNGIAGQPYAASLSATGGTPSYSFTGTGIPAGLSLSQSGGLSGTVKTAGTYSFGVKVSDSGGLSVSGSVSVTFAKPQALTISSASLPAGTVSTAYSQGLSATGGFAPYTWAVSAGSPPPGLALNSSGILSGIPTAAGAFSFGVMATDNSGAIVTASASVTIQALPLTILTQSLPSGVNGIGYPQQVMSASGGMMPYTWSVTSGNLPGGLALSSGGTLSGLPTVAGSFPVTIGVVDAANTKASASFTITIRPSSTDLILTLSSLSYNLLTPTPQIPASAQQFGVQSTAASQQINYSISVSPAAPWLSVAHGTNTPDNVQTSLTSSALGLSPGNYATTITATCTSNVCAGHTQTVSVSLNVVAAPPQLGVTTDILSFGASSSAPMTQSISIQNAGGGTLGIGSVSCEAAWCTVGAPPASLTGGASASIPVTVNPALLQPGFFRTQVDIVSSAGRGSVPVTVLVSSASQLTLAPAGQQFGMQTGGVPGNASGSFLVTVVSGAPVAWTAAVLPGAPWLNLATTSGTSSSSGPGAVSFSIDPVAGAALAPGAYYGRIEVTAPGILNSPQDFEVVLSVSPVTTAVIPDPEPQGLLFITSAAGTPGPQTISVYSGSTSPAGFQTSATTVSGGSWLGVTPTLGSASAGAPGLVSVTVNPSTLTPGVYRGGVSFSLSATAVRVVNVTLIVTPPGTGPQFLSNSISGGKDAKAAACTPTVLVPAQVGLVNNFSEAVAWPVPLSVALSNDCGSVVTSGQMVATFSNGDPPLPLSLADPSKGLYSGTWTPRSAAPQMTVIAHASAAGYPEATAQIAGATVPNAAPVLTPHGTLHSFYPLLGAALAPGTIIQIYGQNLASQTAQPTTIPLPTTMNGTSVIVGGIPAPLYYVSAGQINAQLPFELNAANQYQLLVQFDGAITSPDVVQLSPATPGLAAFGDSTLIAQHGDGSLVSATSPAKSGEYLVAYLAGMGPTNANPASGAASPVNPLALPAIAPTLTINGTASPIAFAGLTPGLVGLYQMNFQVPAGMPAGNLTLVVSQGGQASNPTVLPYTP
jgi:hypothetical protein